MEVNDEELLLNEIRSVGLDDANLPKVMAQLRAYVDKVKLDMPDYNNGDDDKSADANIDAVLGGIINSALGERTASSAVKKDSTPVDSSLFSDSDNEGTSSSSGGSSSDSDSSDEEEGEYPKHKQLHKQLRKIQDNDDRNEFILKAIEWMDEDEKAAFFEPLDDGEDSDVDEDEMTPQERADRAALIDKYVKPATTELERDRRQVLAEFDPLPLSKAHDETDLYMVQQYRLVLLNTVILLYFGYYINTLALLQIVDWSRRSRAAPERSSFTQRRRRRVERASGESAACGRCPAHLCPSSASTRCKMTCCFCQVRWFGSATSASC